MPDNLREKSVASPEHLVAAMQNGIETLELYCLVDMPSRTPRCFESSDNIDTLVPMTSLDQLHRNVFETVIAAQTHLDVVEYSRKARIKICPITVTGIAISGHNLALNSIILSYDINLNHPVVILSPGHPGPWRKR